MVVISVFRQGHTQKEREINTTNVDKNKTQMDWREAWVEWNNFRNLEPRVILAPCQRYGRQIA